MSFNIYSDVWAQEEVDTLYWYYVQSKSCKDVVGSVISQIEKSGQKIKSRIAVIQQLLQQDIISLAEFNDLMKFEDSQYEREAKSSLSNESLSQGKSSEDSDSNNQLDDIKVIRKTQI